VRWVASRCGSAGPAAPGGCGACYASRARHQATSSKESEVTVGPTVRTWRSSPVAWALPVLPGGRPRHGRAGTGEASPTFAPGAMPEVSADDEQRSQRSGQIHRPRASTLSRLARPDWLILGRRRPSVLRKAGGELRDVATCNWNRRSPMSYSAAKEAPRKFSLVSPGQVTRDPICVATVLRWDRPAAGVRDRWDDGCGRLASDPAAGRWHRLYLPRAGGPSGRGRRAGRSLAAR
jgi:hypothetical protein